METLTYREPNPVPSPESEPNLCFANMDAFLRANFSHPRERIELRKKGYMVFRNIQLLDESGLQPTYLAYTESVTRHPDLWGDYSILYVKDMHGNQRKISFYEYDKFAGSVDYKEGMILVLDNTQGFTHSAQGGAITLLSQPRYSLP